MNNNRGTSLITLILFTSLLFTVFHGGVMAQTLLDEVSLIRSQDKKSILDISDVALKFIPIGTPENKAIDYLKSQGFKIYLVEQKYLINSPDLDSAFNSSYKFKTSTSIFYDEIEISIGIKNGFTKSVMGRVINRAF